MSALVSSLGDIIDLKNFSTIQVDGFEILKTARQLSEKNETDATNFNKRAKGYDRGSEGVGWIGPRISADLCGQYFDEHTPFDSDSSSLLTAFEIGSANGYAAKEFSAGLQARGFDTVTIGVDIAEKILAQGLEKERLDYAINADGIQALEDVRSDSVHTLNVLGVSEFFEPDGLPRLAEHAPRVLVPGGVLNFSCEAEGAQGYPGNRQYSKDQLLEIFARTSLRVYREPLVVSNAWRNKKENADVSNILFTAYVPQT